MNKDLADGVSVGAKGVAGGVLQCAAVLEVDISGTGYPGAAMVRDSDGGAGPVGLG